MKLIDIAPGIKIHGVFSVDYEEIKCSEYEDIIAYFLENIPSVKDPTLINVGGCWCSGKTTQSMSLLQDNPGFVYINFDDVMCRIGEYQSCFVGFGGEAAFDAWKISAAIIGYEILCRAVEKRANILFDHSGVAMDHTILFKNIKNLGYCLKFYQTKCSADEVIKRVSSRNQNPKFGRFTPLNLVEQTIENTEIMMEKYKKIFDSFIVIDTNTTS
ncbi:MAG: zeta toxin family protein [Rickettsiales bacterium]|jgi:hypothetical protein|nr:zeta toxin family protein [Rickettsiales bacterium]